MMKRRLVGVLALVGLMVPTLSVSAKLEIPALAALQQSVTQLPSLLSGMTQPEALADVAVMAPLPTEIAQGAILEPGQSGYSVRMVKRLLQELKYPVRPGDYFDQNMAVQISKFQQTHDLVAPASDHAGKVGPATLSLLRERAIWTQYDASLGKRLASYARSNSSGGQSRCYRYVAIAIHAHVKPFLEGMHAYMAAPHLAKSDRFHEVKVPVAGLKQLPAGAVVVWDKGNSASGHISIADGKGREISDHVAPQMLSHYGGAGHRVFLPIEPF